MSYGSLRLAPGRLPGTTMGVTTYRETFSVADTAGASESVTCTVKLSRPVAEAVPEITPDALASFSPAGSDPEASDHWYGVMPPAALNFTEYGTPLVAVGRVLPVVTTSPETPTVMASEAELICAAASESVTSATKVKLPPAVGVPEITPVAAWSLRPAGSDPTGIDQL